MAAKKFTEQQVREEVAALKGGKPKTDSEVFRAWMDLASEWLNDDEDILLEGFIGFNQRDADTIVADFDVNKRLL